MDLMKHLIKTNLNVINVLFFLLGLSLFTSKSGVVIFSVFLSLRYLLKSKHLFLSEKYKSLFYMAFVTLWICLISSIITDPTISSTIFTLRKSLFLIVFFSIILLSNKSSLIASFIGITLGLLIAMSYSLKLFILSPEPLREIIVGSFWDVGRWREFLSYAACILLPFLITKPTSYLKHSSIIIYFILILFSILITGGRSPYLSIGISAVAFILLFKREHLLSVSIILSITTAVIAFTNNPISNTISSKIESITNTEDNYSNIARLTMYKESTLFILYKLTDQPKQFIFGSGDKNMPRDFEAFLNQSDTTYAQLQVSTDDQFSIKDHHNAYLNNLSKRGVIYFFCFYFFIYRLLKQSYQDGKSGNSFHQAAFILLVCYLVTGLVYSNDFSYQPIVMFSLWALLSSYGNLSPSKLNTEETKYKNTA
jgi:O-antigen ligase